MAAKKTTAKIEDKITKGVNDATAFGQQNVDAFVKSSEVATKVAEGLGEEITAFSKKSFEDTVAAAQDMAASKTATELFEKQSAFATAAFEGFVAQATKMNAIFTSAAKDISAPLNARATETVKSFTA